MAQTQKEQFKVKAVLQQVEHNGLVIVKKKHIHI